MLVLRRCFKRKGSRMKFLTPKLIKRKFTQTSRSLMFIWEKTRDSSCSVVSSVDEKMFSLVDGIAKQ